LEPVLSLCTQQKECVFHLHQINIKQRERRAEEKKGRGKEGQGKRRVGEKKGWGKEG
jgi:hypothetical protein